MLEPGDVLIDCTGSNSLLRDRLVPGSDEVDEGANTFKIRLEYALVITFLYGQPYDCNEYCKYYKNIDNAALQVHPDGSPHALRRQRQPRHRHRQHHRRGVRGDAVPIRRRVASRQLSRRRRVDGPLHRQDQAGNRMASCSATWRSSGYPWICTGLGMRPTGSGGQRGPATTHSPAHRCSWRAIRPSALRTFSRSRLASSVRCSWRDSSRSVTCHSETCSIATRCSCYKQWLRVYMRSKMIKHNKDLFESVDEPLALLDKLHIY